MNNNLPNSDLLIQYLDDELNAEEKLLVEKELLQNPGMQQELKSLKIAKDAVRDYGLKQRVAAIHAEMMSSNVVTEKTKKTGVVRVIARRTMRIAASLLVIMLGFGVYQYTTVSSDKLFDENFQPYSLSVSRGAGTAGAIESAYALKDYTKVISLFTALSAAAQKDIFFAGQAYLSNKNYVKAVECFNKVETLNIAENNNIFKDDAAYYLALSYLKNNQFSAAYPIFNSIHNNTSHMYNDKMTSSFMRKLKILSWKK